MEITPIAFIASPYKQKFAIPRQPGLVPSAQGEIVFTDDFADANALRGLDQFSHLWLIFRFHATADKGWTPTVQPPRLGGRERVGVFATRSTFRPNGLGLSVVENLGWKVDAGRPVLRVAGIDLLDGTPIIDIKPYVPYADSIPDARAGFASEAPGGGREVVFEAAAESALATLGPAYPGLRALVTDVLRQDPRPAWRQREVDDKQYGMSLFDLNIKWKVGEDRIRVLAIARDADDNVGS